MQQKLFSGQRVLVMGLGLHGGGVATAWWLVKHGARVTVTDLKTRASLAPSIKKLASLDISYVLGGHRLRDFTSTDIVIQNPGVPRESKFLAAAHAAGVPIENDATLFFKYCQGQIVGVTGTRGKSTTATLTYELLKQDYQTWLAGLPGKPMLGIIDRVADGDVVVLELSSWQLELLGKQQLSPEVAVVTNMLPDHLNRYRLMSEYARAKEQIVRYQSASDVAVLNRDDAVVKNFAKHARHTRAAVVWFSKKQRTPLVRHLKLTGEHNIHNARAAIAVAQQYGVSASHITAGLKRFIGLPSRFELIRKKGGVAYINDTTATTPDATMAALAQCNNKSVVLIAGGTNKGIPVAKFKALASVIDKKCRAVVLFPGEGSVQILTALRLFKPRHVVTNVSTMSDAVGLARTLAKAGDSVVLSPACASFNMFVNEYDRGEQFNQIVRRL